jgi:hypothetical protein
LMSVVYKPMTQEEYEFIQKHREGSAELLKNNLS